MRYINSHPQEQNWLWFASNPSDTNVPHNPKSVTQSNYPYIFIYYHKNSANECSESQINAYNLVIFTYVDLLRLIHVTHCGLLMQYDTLTLIHVMACHLCTGFGCFCAQYLQKITNHKSKISLEFKFRITFHKISRWSSLSKCLSAYQRLSYD